MPTPSFAPPAFAATPPRTANEIEVETTMAGTILGADNANVRQSRVCTAFLVVRSEFFNHCRASPIQASLVDS
jgi:hypothetical protein